MWFSVPSTQIYACKYRDAVTVRMIGATTLSRYGRYAWRSKRCLMQPTTVRQNLLVSTHTGSTQKALDKLLELVTSQRDY